MVLDSQKMGAICGALHDFGFRDCAAVIVGQRVAEARVLENKHAALIPNPAVQVKAACASRRLIFLLFAV